MNATHYFSQGPSGFSPEGDFARLDMFDPFDVILFGKGASTADVARLQREFPAKTIGKYYMCAFEFNAQEEASYKAFCVEGGYPPANMSNRYTGVGRVIGLMHEGTVAWHAARAKAIIGTAEILMSDDSDPKQPIGDPRLYTPADVANWRVWVPAVMAGIKEAIGEARLVPNVGHSCNPLSVGNPDLIDCYRRFCGSVNGIGIEKKTGSMFATYSPGSFIGPYRSPRTHLAFAQDAAAWDVTDGMLLPQSVVKSCVKWVVVEAGGM